MKIEIMTTMATTPDQDDEEDVKEERPTSMMKMKVWNGTNISHIV